MKHKTLPFLLCLFALPLRAEGILTYDPTNVVQTTIAAQEAVKQTARQLEQYQTQLQQLENQIKNTANPDQFAWDNAQQTIQRILTTLDTLNGLQAEYGSLANYLAQFAGGTQSDNSCLGTNSCTAEQLADFQKIKRMGLDSQKSANDAMLMNLYEQQQQLQEDAALLAALQQQAEGSTGQMQALQSANQITSNLAAQLLQIRTLMIAQQTAEAARAAAQVDTEARAQASHKAFVGSGPDTQPAFQMLDYTNPPPAKGQP